VDSWCPTPEALDRALWWILIQSHVSVERVGTSYNFASLDHAVGAFITKNFRGGTVVVKTSTAGDRSAHHEVSKSLLDRVLRITLRSVSAGQVVIADGPAFDVPYRAECNRLEWTEVAERYGVSIGDFNYDPSIEVSPGWPVSTDYLSSDLVLNLTKAKTHRRFGVSLAEKSLLGVLSGHQLGYPKLLGRHNFTTALLQVIQRRSPPIFSVIDGIRGIQGQGPLRGHPSSSSFIVFGTECLGPDIRATVEMGFDPAMVPAFHRPYPETKVELSSNWWQLRISDVDFIPSTSCSWLYRSLRNSPRTRARMYEPLMAGAKALWRDLES
jgi:uncharacterized protein (DUF362 family)